MFSGGPDSTLAALYALKEAQTVHLLTYHHKYMGKIGKHSKVIDEMIEIYGVDRIVVFEQKIDDLFLKYYFENIKKYIWKYRTFYIPWICGACKLAMHVSTINYNKSNNISITYDGANTESAYLFPAQMNSYIEVMMNLYKSHGVEYGCPVYDVDRTDRETEKFGLITTKNTKDEHVVFSTQHTCIVGLFIHGHGRLYYRPFRGKDRTYRLSGEFLENIIRDCKLAG